MLHGILLSVNVTMGVTVKGFWFGQRGLIYTGVLTPGSPKREMAQIQKPVVPLLTHGPIFTVSGGSCLSADMLPGVKPGVHFGLPLN